MPLKTSNAAAAQISFIVAQTTGTIIAREKASSPLAICELGSCSYPLAKRKLLIPHNRPLIIPMHSPQVYVPPCKILTPCRYFSCNSLTSYFKVPCFSSYKYRSCTLSISYTSSFCIFRIPKLKLFGCRNKAISSQYSC